MSRRGEIPGAFDPDDDDFEEYDSGEYEVDKDDDEDGNSGPFQTGSKKGTPSISPFGPPPTTRSSGPFSSGSPFGSRQQSTFDRRAESPLPSTSQDELKDLDLPLELPPRLEIPAFETFPNIAAFIQALEPLRTFVEQYQQQMEGRSSSPFSGRASHNANARTNTLFEANSRVKTMESKSFLYTKFTNFKERLATRKELITQTEAAWAATLKTLKESWVWSFFAPALPKESGKRSEAINKKDLPTTKVGIESWQLPPVPLILGYSDQINSYTQEEFVAMWQAYAALAERIDARKKDSKQKDSLQEMLNHLQQQAGEALMSSKLEFDEAIELITIMRKKRELISQYREGELALHESLRGSWMRRWWEVIRPSDGMMRNGEKAGQDAAERVNRFLQARLGTREDFHPSQVAELLQFQIQTLAPVTVPEEDIPEHLPLEQTTADSIELAYHWTAPTLREFVGEGKTQKNISQLEAAATWTRHQIQDGENYQELLDQILTLTEANLQTAQRIRTNRKRVEDHALLRILTADGENTHELISVLTLLLLRVIPSRYNE